MPPFEAFRDAESDHATLAHGLTHWTEHPQRQCRDLGRKSWNDAGYAAEELIAKLARCLVPAFDGAYFSEREKEALWDRFYTEAPQRQRRSVEQYNIVKRA